MSEHKLDCCVVRDLLPAYVEDLTEADTAKIVDVVNQTAGFTADQIKIIEVE